ncbi:MAG TPA: Clp protease N-terminal domain-containing protein, partial [Solirubrobacteraceae bacterium]|nr:Clp protease N-terminal domain-containing protein [Solirubrobacteraceae bacterium]
MQADRFTIKTQEALQAAIALAHARRHSQITPLHLLTALLDQEGGFVTPVLGKIGVAPSALRGDLESALGAMPTLGSEAEPTMAPEVMATLRKAEREMRSLKDSFLS